jgi:hypothetical protein
MILIYNGMATYVNNNLVAVLRMRKARLQSILATNFINNPVWANVPWILAVPAVVRSSAMKDVVAAVMS